MAVLLVRICSLRRTPFLYHGWKHFRLGKSLLSSRIAEFPPAAEQEASMIACPSKGVPITKYRSEYRLTGSYSLDISGTQQLA